MVEKVMTIDIEFAGMRLDKFLTRCFDTDGIPEKYSRTELQRLIEDRQVLLNGHQTKASAKLKPNDIIFLRTCPLREISLVPEKIPLDILYEDQHCVVINKAAGTMVHPATGKFTGTLVNALLHHCPGLDGIGGVRRPGLIHRLDKDTSGVMVVAKTAVALERLARQFKNREVEKEYVALVWGKFSVNSGVIDQPIGRHRSDRKRMSSRYSVSNARDAVTEWQVQRTFKICRDASSRMWVSWLRLMPKTGRTHQLRVHLADSGFPIVGDKVYGFKRKDHLGENCITRELENFPRQALHALKLRLIHPNTENQVTFCAPLPEDMQRLRIFLDNNTAS